MSVQEVASAGELLGRRRLPAGVGVVAASGLAGLAVFAYFAIADRSLGEVAGDQFAVFYTLSVVIGFGAFQPLETEMARTLAHRDDVGAGLREAATASAVVALAVTAVVGAAAVPLLGLFGRDGSGSRAGAGAGWLLAATVGVVAVSALQFWVRGALLGLGRPTAFAATIAVDSVLRLLLAGAVVLVLADPSSAAFSLSLLLPLLLAHLAFVPAVRRGARRPGPASGGDGRPRTGARGLLLRISPLFAATLSAQVLAGAPVLVVAALAPEGVALAFLFSFTVARVPLFMAVPVQGALVPPMAAMVVAGRLDRLVRLLLAVTGAVALVAVAGGALAAWLGPPVLGALFPRAGSLPGGDLALMVVGVAAHVGLLVTAQATVAAGHHRGSAVAWVSALALAAAVFAAGPLLDPVLGTAAAVQRVEWAFAAGSGAGWALAMVLLLRHARRERARQHRESPPHRDTPRPDAEEPA